MTRRLITRTYRTQLDEAEDRLTHELALIGHAEYPRRLTATGLVEGLDRLLDVNRRLLAWGYLKQDAAKQDAERLLALRRKALIAADDDGNER